MIEPTAAPSPARFRFDFWFWIFLVGTGVHVWACFQLPRDVGDLGRQVLSGLMVKLDGWSAAHRSLTEWSPELARQVSWGAIAYNYPPLTLLFFFVSTWIYPSLFTAKILLTLLDLANAWLITRLTDDRRVGTLYWCLPLSIWWVSHEGSSEPVQNTFMLLALVAAFRHRAVLSPGLLLLGVQTKLTAVFLAPFVLWKSLTTATERSDRLRMVGLSLLALLPTAVAWLAYPVISQVLHTFRWSARFNLYHWRTAFDSSYRWWAPARLVVVTEIVSTALLIWVAWLVVHEREREKRLTWLAPLLFLAAAKVMGVFQPWYFIAFIPLWLPAVAPDRRLCWLLLTQCCDPLSVWQLTFGPSGPNTPAGGLGLFQALTPH